VKVFWSAVLEMGFVRYPDGDSGMFPDCLDDHLTGAYVFVNLIWIWIVSILPFWCFLYHPLCHFWKGQP